MAKALTDIGIRNMRPRGVRVEIPDRTPLLYLVLQPSGRRRFVLRYRIHGQSRKVTLQAGLTLAAARKAAADAALDLDRGVDPREARKAAKAKAAEAAANTLQAVCAEYLRREGPKLRTVDQRTRLLTRHVYPALGARPIGDVKRGELVRLFDRIEDDSGARTADVVLSILRKIFNWRAVRDETFVPPIVKGMRRKPAAESVRTRILTDAELARVWHAADPATPYGGLTRLLLLTAARRGEAAVMRWSEIDGAVWNLPPERNKTKQPLARPLSGAALAVLTAQPRVEGCPYVFSTDGRRPLSGLSQFKRKLDAACGVVGWTHHDLRRTSRSLLSRCGVNADIAEMCLGHVLPTIRRTYDRHRYVDEMQRAFEALAAQIERIVDPRENVVPLRGAAP